MKKLLIRIVIGILALLIILILAKDLVIKSVLAGGVSAITGFPTTIRSLKYDFPATVHVRDLMIQNPKNKGFEKEVFVEIPEIFFSINLDPILKQEKIHLPEVRLNIAQVHIEKNKEGVSNVELLTSVVPEEKKKVEKPVPKEKKEPMPFQLDRLILTMHDVSYVDRSGVMPKKMAVDLNVENQLFENINNPMALVNLILMKIVYGTTFGNLGINTDALQNTVSDIKDRGQVILKDASAMVGEQAGAVVGQTRDMMTQQAAEAEKILGKTGETLGGGVRDVGSSVGDAADATKEKLSGMFGKLKSTVAGE